MPSKKRKYETRFPPARIKKIMQTNEEIGKVAGAVPIIISRSLEIFLQSLVETTADYTNERRAKTMTTSHLKHCIESEKKFDFLKELVANIADVSNQDEEEGNDIAGDRPKKQRKPRAPAGERKKRKKESSSDPDDSDAPSEEDMTNPRKQQATMAEPSADLATQSHLPTVIPPSLPSSQPLAHSIDSIMGTSQKSKQTSIGTDLSTPGSSFQSTTQQGTSFPSMQQPTLFQPSTTSLSQNFSFSQTSSTLNSTPSIMMSTSMSATVNEDEDDDYDV